jgi:hypothetical protein
MSAGAWEGRNDGVKGQTKKAVGTLYKEVYSVLYTLPKVGRYIGRYLDT